MTNNSCLDRRHPYHLVDPSPWPITLSFASVPTTVGGVLAFHSIRAGGLLLGSGLGMLLYTLFLWWRDVIRESTYAGLHSACVHQGHRYGFLMFIASEVMFFIAFFWAFFHSALGPAVESGAIWPPHGLMVPDPWGIPFLNTLILLGSGASVTWAHHALFAGSEKAAVNALAVTIWLALLFVLLQAMEYRDAPFTMSDGIYGSTFFVATGFHGVHVIIGTIFLICCAIRHYLGHFTPTHHFGFEAAAWYWHFVDVVWLFLFVSIYWWGGH
uniref:Cytochrome c oxidase subunit 3 n=1 Tax=Selaginella moellendorffii TaxID=88036 RepID=F2YIA1_SELML|nr:cytochrome oxidase subunit 3 [Selaginella moellendorffii]AEA29867.1 cytochrome c oxidase subunit 3 [Selaginella moellendorffii]